MLLLYHIIGDPSKSLGKCLKSQKRFVYLVRVNKLQMENFLTENKQINQEETFLCCASGSDAKTNKQTNKKQKTLSWELNR